MSSKTFIEIHRIVMNLNLNNTGFRARDIFENTKTIKQSTVKT